MIGMGTSMYVGVVSESCVYLHVYIIHVRITLAKHALLASQQPQDLLVVIRRIKPTVVVGAAGVGVDAGMGIGAVVSVSAAGTTGASSGVSLGSGPIRKTAQPWVYNPVKSIRPIIKPPI